MIAIEEERFISIDFFDNESGFPQVIPLKIICDSLYGRQYLFGLTQNTAFIRRIWLARMLPSRRRRPIRRLVRKSRLWKSCTECRLHITAVMAVGTMVAAMEVGIHPLLHLRRAAGTIGTMVVEAVINRISLAVAVGKVSFGVGSEGGDSFCRLHINFLRQEICSRRRKIFQTLLRDGNMKASSNFLRIIHPSHSGVNDFLTKKIKILA